MDLLGRNRSLRIRTLATGRPKLPSPRCAVYPWFFYKWGPWNNINGIGTAYSVFAQSNPTGQSNAPVRSWWKPRSILILRPSGGLRDWPRGVIQSNTGPLILFVSSDRALETPFWSFEQKFWISHITYVSIMRTIPAISSISPSSPFRRHPSRPGTICNSDSKTWCTRLSLLNNYTRGVKDLEGGNRAYSYVKDSSGSPASSPMRNTPVLRMARTLHNACTVRPKWRPWWTRGSVTHLVRVLLAKKGFQNFENLRLLFGPKLKGSRRPLLVIASQDASVVLVRHLFD